MTASRLAEIAAASALLVSDPNANGSRVERVDRFALRIMRLDDSRAKPHGNGWIDAWGVATRVGVFDYDDPAMPGGIFREYRPRDEVMAPESLGSLKGVPFTIQHPDGEVDSQNAQQLTHGWVLEVQPVGDLVEVKVRIATEDAKAAYASGTVELSCGYSALLEETSGVAPDGERYDGIQREIRYNHLALVDLARAGPVARLKLDGYRVQRTDQAPSTRKRRTMKKGIIRFDGRKLAAPAYVLAGLEAEADHAKDQILRGDQIQTGKLTIEIGEEGPVELTLPSATIEQVLGMLGAVEAPAEEAPAEEAPAEPEGVEDETPEEMAPAPEGEESAEAPAPRRPEDNRADALLRAFDSQAGRKLIADAAAEAVTKALDEERRINADLADTHRKAVPMLDAGYKFDGLDAFKIKADAIASVHPEKAETVRGLELAARGGDQRAAGRLDGMFDASENAQRDADDRSGDLLKALDDSSSQRADAKADADPVRAARQKRLERRADRRRPAKAKAKADK